MAYKKPNPAEKRSKGGQASVDWAADVLNRKGVALQQMQKQMKEFRRLTSLSQSKKNRPKRAR